MISDPQVERRFYCPLCDSLTAHPLARDGVHEHRRMTEFGHHVESVRVETLEVWFPREMFMADPRRAERDALEFARFDYIRNNEAAVSKLKAECAKLRGEVQRLQPVESRWFVARVWRRFRRLLKGGKR